MRLLDTSSHDSAGAPAARAAAAVVALLVVASFGGVLGSAAAQQSAVATDAAPETVAAGDAGAVDGANLPLQTADEANETNETEQFDLDADMVDRCGPTCRTVSANLTNIGNETVYNATVVTNITAGGDVIYQRTDDVGNVSVNESVERTDDLSISPVDAFRISRNDGWITINTTVRWDGGNQTFTERRQVL